ncbi:MAG: zinc ABC transporter substrate-binding protein [Rhodothermales bacterium]
MRCIVEHLALLRDALPALPFVLLVGTGCASNAGTEDSGRLTVVTTTSMIADLAAQLGGEHVDATGLMGPGVDPHLYKASAGDVGRMGGADVILYNGFHLEGKMTDVFDQMKGRGIPTFAVAEESISEDRLIESEQFSGNYDPHVWFDVEMWQDVARRTAEALAEMDPEHADAYEERLETYLDEMEDVDAYVRRRTAEIPEDKRVVVTSHDAFGYLGRAYGFDVRGLQGISTATEAGTADVQQLAAFVAERRIPALFVETSVSPRGIEAVRQAVRSRGFEVSIGGTLYGDALGEPGTPAGTYLGMMRENIDTIVSSLTRPTS